MASITILSKLSPFPLSNNLLYFYFLLSKYTVHTQLILRLHPFDPFPKFGSPLRGVYTYSSSVLNLVPLRPSRQLGISRRHGFDPKKIPDQLVLARQVSVLFFNITKLEEFEVHSLPFTNFISIIFKYHQRSRNCYTS